MKHFPERPEQREVLQHNFLQPVVHAHSEAVPDVKMEFPPQSNSNFTLKLAW